MKSPLRILHLEDDPRDAELVRETLSVDGTTCQVTRVETEADFAAALEQTGFDLILADYTLPSFDGLSALKIAQRDRPHVPFIFVSGTLGEEIAIEALKTGATDYVFKTRLSRIVPSVQRALRETEERIELSHSEESLRRSESYLAQAQKLSHTGSFGCKVSTGEMSWSEETFRIFAYDPATKPAVERILQRVHPEDKAMVQEHIDRAVRDGTDCDLEYCLLLPDDSVKHVRVVANAVKDEAGKIEFVGAVMDVTATKQAEAALRRSEAYLAEAQKLSHTGSFGWDVSSGEIYWSQETSRIFEYQPSAKVTIEMIVHRTHPDDRLAVQELIERVSRERKEWDFEHRLLMPDGSVKYLRVMGHPSKDELGRFEFVGAVTDITERRRAEEALRASERSLRLIVDSIPGLVNTTTAAGEIELANQQLLDYVGMTLEELKNWRPLVHPDDRELVATLWSNSVESGHPYEDEHRLRRADDVYRWFHARGLPLRDKEGRIVRWYILLTDIDERKKAEEKLRRSEAYLAQAQRLTHTGSWVSQVPGRDTVHVSEEWYRILGFDPAEGMPSWEKRLQRVHPADRAKLQDVIERAIREKSEYELEYRIFLPDGSVKWIHGVGHPVFNASGDLAQFMGSSTDITERKQADEALRRSESYLAQAQRLALVGSWAWQIPGMGALHLSEEWYRIHGFDPKDGMPTWEQRLQRIHPEDRARYQAAVNRAIAEKSGYDVEFRILPPHSVVRFIHSVGQPVLGPSGELLQFVGVGMDVTASRRAEEALRRSENYLAEAQRLTHTGSWASDGTTHEALYWSEEMFRIFGFDPQLGLPMRDQWLQRIHPEDRDKVRQQASDRMFLQKVHSDVEFRIVLPNGTVKHIHGLAHPVFNSNRELVEVVGTAVDITERKRAEEERERLREQLAHLAHLNRVTTMGELTASLAHEIKQPISAAAADAETCFMWLARDQPDLAEAQEAALRIMKDVTRASDIINRIVLLFKKHIPRQELVDVNGVIQEMIALLRSEATRYSVSIRAELSNGLPKIMADRVGLQQVLMNLMLNAIEAMKEMGAPGTLAITTRLDENGQLLVSVTDTGMGLPQENGEEIFNPFFTSKPQGTGMGLSISRSIIELHGGRLWASSNSGLGATFQFTLPFEAAASQSA
ncbi:MAG TPA: PAS domain-containing protein [Candidatus Acidoferrum sp.]|nr:PAS domain-containing protein [Candidatus Acidoferrum sp.]